MTNAFCKKSMQVELFSFDIVLIANSNLLWNCINQYKKINDWFFNFLIYFILKQ